MTAIKIRRMHREELPGAQIVRDVVRRGAEDVPIDASRIQPDPTLSHLLTHDPDGFFTALLKDETLGFVASSIRSRQWFLSELCVLPQHRHLGAGERLLEQALGYGTRSGAAEYVALVPGVPDLHALLLGTGFQPACPVYRFELDDGIARRLGATLHRLLPAHDVTEELLQSRGQSDLDRLDKLVRGITRAPDHLHWVRERNFTAWFIHHHDRVAAYAYGGRGQAGPVSGTTRDAALAALGCGILSAARNGSGEPVSINVPAPFSEAIEALLEADAVLVEVLTLFARGARIKTDRWIPGTTTLP